MSYPRFDISSLPENVGTLTGAADAVLDVDFDLDVDEADLFVHETPPPQRWEDPAYEGPHQQAFPEIPETIEFDLPEQGQDLDRALSQFFDEFITFPEQHEAPTQSTRPTEAGASPARIPSATGSRDREMWPMRSTSASASLSGWTSMHECGVNMKLERVLSCSRSSTLNGEDHRPASAAEWCLAS